MSGCMRACECGMPDITREHLGLKSLHPKQTWGGTSQPSENWSWVVSTVEAQVPPWGAAGRGAWGGCVPAPAAPSASPHTHGVFLPALTLVVRLALGGRSPDFPCSSLGLRPGRRPLGNGPLCAVLLHLGAATLPSVSGAGVPGPSRLAEGSCSVGERKPAVLLQLGV